ncbi:MAG: hypothetical protein IT337_08795, partial [Thermomicrobiales bacterium]|nr:hypothetical protein [Thermomicrobiales bacterium]
GAFGYAEAGAVAGGLGRNRRYFENHAGGIVIDAAVAPVLATLLFDPQTSGGLLFTAPPASVGAVRAAFAALNAQVWEIGFIGHGQGITVVP